MTSPVVAVSLKFARRAKEFLNRYYPQETPQREQILPTERILWHREQIGKGAAQLEQRFLTVSAGVEALSGKSSELVVRSRELLKRALGHDEAGSMFKLAVDLVEGPLVFNSECLEIIRELTGNLEVMSGRISKLDGFRCALDRSIAPLKLLQTMFRIESATSSPEIQALFSSISLEIERLQSRMSTMVAKEFEAIDNTRATLSSVLARLREIHSQQLGVATRRVEIEASLSELQQQVDLNRGRDVHLISVTQTIAAKVSEMVTALQYQDILNQRMEHVSRGLSEMAQQLQVEGKSKPSDLSSFLREMCRVEAAQLEEVEHILTGAVEKLQASLSGVSYEIETLNSECFLLKDIEAASVTSNSTVQILLDAIEETRGFSESTYAQTDDIWRALEPIGGLVGGLTESILEVSNQINLIALNAQIQAVKAGEGTGLEVLSARTCGISQEIAAIVEEISSELTALRDGLKSGLETVELTRNRNREFMELLKTSGAEQEARLHEFRDQAFAELHSVQELTSEIQVKSAGLSSALDLRESVLDPLRLAREELRSFSNRISTDPADVMPNARVEERTGSYTAASERAAHERALHGGPALSPVDSPPAESVEGSVEFF